MEQEAVHKVKIGAKRRKGIQRAADESGKDAVMGEFVDPVCKGRGVRPMETIKKKRIKERRIWGWFLAGLPVEE